MALRLKSLAITPQNSAPPAPSPGPAAAAATSAAAAPAATRAAATTATTASAAEGDFLRARTAADILLVEEMERGETDVGHLFVVENEALIGPGVVGLRGISGGDR